MHGGGGFELPPSSVWFIRILRMYVCVDDWVWSAGLKASEAIDQSVQVLL